MDFSKYRSDIDMLEVLEALRWKAYESADFITGTTWDKCFSILAKKKEICGYGADGRLRLFKCDNGYSYSSDIAELGMCSNKNFVRCVEDEELPLLARDLNEAPKGYIEAVKARINGTLSKIERDDAWVRNFMRLDRMLNKRRAIMGHILEIIKDHCISILMLECRKKPNNDFLFDTIKICLKLNGRSYIYTSKEFLLLPEEVNAMVPYDLDKYKLEDQNGK